MRRSNSGEDQKDMRHDGREQQSAKLALIWAKKMIIIMDHNNKMSLKNQICKAFIYIPLSYFNFELVFNRILINWKQWEFKYEEIHFPVWHNPK